ncbi:MAG TPA: DUF4349 domain-containing protein [Chloroflexota bacterium]|nr:DUF4349 domain-containing protein [Chloroflexota bacterium]
MKSKRVFIAPLLLGAIAVLASCGAGQQISAAVPAASAASQGRAIGAPAQAGARPAQLAAASAPSQQQFQGAAGLQPLPPVNRMVIKNGSLSISVDDPEASLGDVDQLVKAEQGVIASQTVRTQGDKTFANLVIQVPPDNFEETLAKLRELRAHDTRVLSDAASSQDVTEQYVDLAAQHRNLQATRDAYQKLLDKATAVSDVISLTREVANIQTQMDQIQGRQNLLTSQSAISTIALSLSPVGAAALPHTRPLPNPSQAAQDAWRALLVGLQGLAVVLIWMAVLLPVPTAVLGMGWIVYRRATRSQERRYQADGTRN